MTCQLTATVECVADMMYQLTPMKFMPLPNSDTNIAAKKYRKPRCDHSSFQSTRFVVAVAIKLATVLSGRSLAFFFRRPGLQPRRNVRRMNWALAPEDSQPSVFQQPVTRSNFPLSRSAHGAQSRASARQAGIQPSASGSFE